MRLVRIPLVVLLTSCTALSGCGKPKPPPIVPAEGTVYLNDRPLPFARVDFIPMLEDFGAEMNSWAVTDENGHYVLECAHGQLRGAAVAKHRVLVTEHTPDDMRGGDGRSQHKLAEYQVKLKNRPIPDSYGMLAKEMLSVEVKAGQTVYDLKLTR